MNEFIYTIKDENGIHARPAGLLAKKAQAFPFEIPVECNGRTASLKKLLALMGLGIKKGDTVKVFADKGNDISKLKEFFEETV